MKTLFSDSFFIVLGFFWQLCGEVSSLGSELSLAKVEGQRSAVALEEAGRSQAELVRDKAALVVQLTASEKDNTVLSEELAAFRCFTSVGSRTSLPPSFCLGNVWLLGLQVGAGVPGNQSVRGAAAAGPGRISARTGGSGEPNPSGPQRDCSR